MFRVGISRLCAILLKSGLTKINMFNCVIPKNEVKIKKIVFTQEQKKWWGLAHHSQSISKYRKTVSRKSSRLIHLGI